MKRLAGLVLAVTLFALPGTALAASGYYTDQDGLSCSWFGSGSMYQIHCSGFIRWTSHYYSYDCTVYVYGSYSRSWTCRDINGATWRGSS